MKEVSFRAPKTSIDFLGNLVFIGGLTSLLVGVTYALMPYKHDSITDAMGWGNPWVIRAIIVGISLLIIFPFIESKVNNPMFRLEFFRIRAFTYANLASFTAAISRGGAMFMLIMLLQGIWLSLHGYRFEDTPFWAGIYIAPHDSWLCRYGTDLWDTLGQVWSSMDRYLWDDSRDLGLHWALNASL